MDVGQMSIAELETEHRAQDLQVVECRRIQQVLHDEIVRKQQAAFVAGPAHLNQFAQPGSNIEDMEPGMLEALLTRIRVVLDKKKGGQ